MEKKGKLKSVRSLPTKGDLHNKKEEAVEKPVEIHVLGEDPFDLSTLQNSWNKLIAERLKGGGKDSEIILLKLPFRLEGAKIILSLSNAFQQDQLMSYHTDIVTFLRKDLNNRKLELTSELVEEEREGMLYTNREKFEHMMKINPALRVLREKLDLDPDF